MSGLKLMGSHRAEGVTMVEGEKRRENDDQEVHSVLLFSFVKSRQSDSLKKQLGRITKL